MSEPKPDQQSLLGSALLESPKHTKDTAFTLDEREKFGLTGLLPSTVETLDRQVDRVLEQLAQHSSLLDQYIALIALSDTNETLFYKVVMSHPARFLPIVYDPTVADACLAFGHIYRRPKGMYVSIEHKGRVAEVLRNWPERDIRFICVSSGGRILGLGDIGANGMGIPIGKLQLYTASAAVPPNCLLPIIMDIGTTNDEMRNDPLYLGLRREPPSAAELDALVDEFVNAVQDVFPGCCIHFEDWKGTDAIRLLAKYTDKVLCYNDDIQGTASVVLAGLTTALQIKGEPLKDQRILFLGAGSAAIGIANLLVVAMQLEGMSKEDAQARISMFDFDGLLEPSRNKLSPSQKIYTHDGKPTKTFNAAVEAIEPTTIIGVSTTKGAFTQQVVETMAKLNDRPIIFALSNPTDHVECTAEQAYAWTKGKALFAAGVQFPDVELNGKQFHPGQANNFYIFPAIGLAVYATKTKRIPDEAFVAAANASADQVRVADRERGMLFPPQNDILRVEVATATAVAKYFFDQGLAQVERPADINAWITDMLYKPAYA